MPLFATTSESTFGRSHSPESEYEKLLAAMAEGDTEALEKLYQYTKSSVYGFALSILRHPQDAEDVMQETYLHLFRGAAGYEARGKPMAWILTIVRNIARQKLRERPDAACMEEGRASSDPRDYAGISIDRMLLEAAFNILSETERQIIILHSVSGLKHREIASLLEIPLSTVLSKYHRALSKLKKYIEEATS